MKLTKPQRRGLEIVRDNGITAGGQFARLMWPNSSSWQGDASRRGGLNQRGGSFLSRLRGKGWITLHQQDDPATLTEAGIAALSGDKAGETPTMKENQKAVYDFLIECRTAGKPCPTRREIGERVGVAVVTVQWTLRQLHKKGFIDMGLGKTRGITISGEEVAYTPPTRPNFDDPVTGLAAVFSERK